MYIYIYKVYTYIQKSKREMVICRKKIPSAVQDRETFRVTFESSKVSYFLTIFWPGIPCRGSNEKNIFFVETLY